MRPFFASEIPEYLASFRVIQLLGKIVEELLRFSFQIDRQIQSLDMGRPGAHIHTQQFPFRKYRVGNLPADRQTRRLPAQPPVLFEERPVLAPETIHVLGLFMGQIFEHSPPTGVPGLFGGTGIEAVPPPLDGESQFERIPGQDFLLAFPLPGTRFPGLMPVAGTTQPQDGVPAEDRLKIVFLGLLPNKIFELLRRKLLGVPAAIAYEMNVIRLADNDLVARRSPQLQLADHAGFQKDVECAVDSGQPDAVPLFEHPPANFLDGRMVVGVLERLPHHRAL